MARISLELTHQGRVEYRGDRNIDPPARRAACGVVVEQSRLAPRSPPERYARPMAAHISEDDWSPLPGALPDLVEPDSIYVIPTRGPAKDSDIPRYTEAVRYLPKAARAVELPVKFSRATGSREFLSEYSVDPEMWALGIACLQMANDWLIATVTLFIDYRARAQGWSKDEATGLPLKVCVSETETGRNYKIEGSGTDVLEALRTLHASSREIVVRESKEVEGPHGEKHGK